MTEQILQCEGGHTWSRPSQRGRPPKICDDWPNCEAIESAQMTVDEVIEDIELEQGIERLSEFAPVELQDNGNEHLESLDEKLEVISEPPAPPVPNPFLEKAKKSVKNQNLAKARERKTEIKVERTEATREAARQELKTIDDRIEKANQEYVESLKAAIASQGYQKGIWDKSDSRQRVLLNILNRKRVLQRQVGEESFLNSAMPLKRLDEGMDYPHLSASPV